MKVTYECNVCNWIAVVEGDRPEKCPACWSEDVGRVAETIREERDRLLEERGTLRTELQAAKAAIRAMWPVFALALAYGEHGRASEHNGLRRLAEEFRNSPPAGVMDTILDAAERR